MADQGAAGPETVEEDAVAEAAEVMPGDAISQLRSRQGSTRRAREASPPARATAREAVDKAASLDNQKPTTSAGSSVASSVANLSKNIVGAGVLSLSSGLARGTGIVPACLIVTAMAGLSSCMFLAIGSACSTTKQSTFKGVGSVAVSARFAAFVNVICVLKTMDSSLMNSMVISSSCTKILQSFGLPVARFYVLVFSFAGLLPLCLLRDLSALRNVSLLGMLGTIYTLLFMVYRLFDGTYATGGVYLERLEMSSRPNFGNGVNMLGTSWKTGVVVCMASTAFLAHYNAPRFYQELADKSKFPVVVLASFGCAWLLSIGFMVVGYLTFGDAVAGNVLTGYAASDPLATIARVGMAASIICSYPLIFSGLRNGAMELFSIRDEFRIPLTLSMLGAVKFAAASLDDISIIVSLAGAVYGALLVCIIPAIMFLGAASLPEKGGATVASWQRGLAKLVMPVGVILGVGGVIVTLSK